MLLHGDVCNSGGNDPTYCIQLVKISIGDLSAKQSLLVFTSWLNLQQMPTRQV